MHFHIVRKNLLSNNCYRWLMHYFINIKFSYLQAQISLPKLGQGMSLFLLMEKELILILAQPWPHSIKGEDLLDHNKTFLTNPMSIHKIMVGTRYIIRMVSNQMQKSFPSYGCFISQFTICVYKIQSCFGKSLSCNLMRHGINGSVDIRNFIHPRLL